MQSSYLIFWSTILLLVMTTACGGEEKSIAAETKAKEELVIDQQKNQEISVIDLGVEAGDLISGNERLKPGKIRNGEGEFDVYFLSNAADQRIGYVVEDFDAPGKVGDIFITNAGSTAPGAKGIKVGQSWANLQAAFPDVEAYGSEIESRTYAITNDLSFRLNVANSQYELDEAMIPASTKITEILVKAPR